MVDYKEPFTQRMERRYRLLGGLINGEKAQTGPFWADLDITQRCNLKCLGCLYHSPLVAQSKEINKELADISVDFARRVAGELAAMGTHTIILQGAGEPLLHPRLFDIIAAMKAAGLYCRLITNGTLLDDTTVRGLIAAGLDSLRVSVWVNSPRDLEGTSLEEDVKNFNRICSGLALLNRAKSEKGISFPQVEVYQAINRNNYRTVGNLLQLTHEHNCASVHLGHFLTRGGQLEKYSLSAEQEEICLQELSKIRPELEKYNIHHNIDTLKMRFKRGQRVWEQAACFTPWFRLRILVDKSVKICRGCDMTFGSLEKKSLSQIWNGPSLRAFRRKVSTKGGLAMLARESDCYACCFFSDNWRVERIYRWIRPFAAVYRRTTEKL